MNENAIEIIGVKKKYKLGEIGGGTLKGDLQSWWAKVRHKEDPNSMIGTDTSKYGEEFMALDGINLQIKKGEAVGIIGHNGAGKSTLLKLLSRVTAPTEGEIRINGRIASMLEVGTGFHPELTGRENIYMNGAILGMSRKEVDEKIEEIIDFSECRQFIDTPVKRYSSGMYVKLAFSVAAHLDAEIMIMDEVLAVGDAKFQEKCLGKMSLEAKEGKTVLYVSHNMATIKKLCSRCVVLNHGKLIFDGTVDKAIEIYSDVREVSKGEIDLKSIKRAPEFAEHVVTMSKLNVKSDSGLFNVGSKLLGELYVESDDYYSEVMLSVAIRTVSGITITRMISKNCIDIVPSNDNSIHFELDISHIAPGKYELFFVLSRINEIGTRSIMDGLHAIYTFEIIEDASFNFGSKWQPEYFGYYIGPQISIF